MLGTFRAWLTVSKKLSFLHNTISLWYLMPSPLFKWLGIFNYISKNLKITLHKPNIIRKSINTRKSTKGVNHENRFSL
jgi:hypothetical protein